MRTEAILSGLGKGIDTDTLMQRAAEAFQAAAIPEDWHWEMAPNNRDTAVFVTFKDAASLRLAANKIRRASISHGAGIRAWLDARRTRAENKPSRAVHMAAEGLVDLAAICLREGIAAPIERENIEKDMRRLTITRGARGQAICWWNTKLQELAWSEDFKQLCGGINKSSDLEQISAWCSLE